MLAVITYSSECVLHGNDTKIMTGMFVFCSGPSEWSLLTPQQLSLKRLQRCRSTFITMWLLLWFARVCVCVCVCVCVREAAVIWHVIVMVARCSSHGGREGGRARVVGGGGMKGWPRSQHPRGTEGRRRVKQKKEIKTTPSSSTQSLGGGARLCDLSCSIQRGRKSGATDSL